MILFFGYYAFKGDQNKVGKKQSLLAGKLSSGKKVCAFEWCLVLSQKYTKSFGGKSFFRLKYCAFKRNQKKSKKKTKSFGGKSFFG